MNDVVEETIREDNWWERLSEFADYADESDDSEKEEWIECPECHGKRLNKEALSYRIGPYSIADLAVYILFHIIFHYGLSQDVEYSSLAMQ